MEEPLLSEKQTREDSSQAKPVEHSNTLNETKYETTAQFSIDMEKLKISATKANLKKLRSLKLFPLFNDSELCKLSPSYYLYLEFLHGMIRMLVYLLIATIPPAIFIYFQFNENPFFEFDTTPDVRFVYVVMGVAGNFLVSWLRRREENLIYANEALYERNLTEDLFTVVVKGLPHDVTKAEIKEHFEKFIVPESGGLIEDVIFLQDYYRFFRTEEKIKQIDEKIKRLEESMSTSKKPEKDRSEIEKLKNEKTSFQYELEGHRRDLNNFNNFKGKALVVFNTAELQDQVRSYFKRHWYKIPLIKQFKDKYSKYYLRGHVISVHKIGAPDDVLFHFIHYPIYLRAFRNFLAYTCGTFLFLTQMFLFLVVLGGMTFNDVYKAISWTISPESAPENIGEKDLLPKIADFFQPVYMTIVFMTIGYFVGLFYLIVKQLKITSSVIKIEISCFRFGYFYQILTAVIIESVFRCVSGHKNWILDIETILISLFIKKILFKLVDMITTHSKPTTFIKIVWNLIGVAKVYDLFGGISNFIHLGFFAFTFYALNPFLILPLVIATIYVVAALDKYRMLKICDFPKYKSRTLLVRIFRLYRLFPFLFFYGSLNVMRVHSMEYGLTKNNDQDTYIYQLIAAGIISRIAAYVYCPQTVKKQINRKFLDRYGRIEYEEARKEFTSSYRAKYAWSDVQSKPIPRSSTE